MVLLFIGLVLLLTAFSLGRNDSSPAARFVAPLRNLSFVLMLLGLLFSSVKQIDAGYVGVKSLFGKVQNDVLKSGLSLINPLMKVEEIDIRTQNYTMSGQHDEGNKEGDDAIRVLTADGLEVTIDLSLPGRRR